MRALLTLLLGYTAYRMALRIRDENSSRLLLTDQRPEVPETPRPARLRRKRTAPSRTAVPRASAARKRR
jgi:hypothetical protein